MRESGWKSRAARPQNHEIGLWQSVRPEFGKKEKIMKVMLVNGSPHENGWTFTALDEVSKTLNAEGIETEFFWIGTKPLSGCIACGNCEKTGNCVFDDKVNEFRAAAPGYDGFIFGSPVYFASANGAMISFMDRVFYSNLHADSSVFYLKPAAAVVSAKRAGTTATFDQMNKYFTLMQMPVISSQYWNNVHGQTPEDVKNDLKGMQIMRTLGRNMAWFLKCKEAGIKAGVPYPQKEEPVKTNFIR
jgi:multimeric flavodoxin WrbA